MPTGHRTTKKDEEDPPVFPSVELSNGQAVDDLQCVVIGNSSARADTSEK